MTVNGLLGQFNDVRERGDGRWSARCPAHADASPSLSIREGQRGVLLKCWAGCSAEEVCNAVGLKMTDLFYDSGRANASRQRMQPKPRVDLRHVAFQFDLHAFDLAERAKRVLEAATGVDLSKWPDDDLDRVLRAVGHAYEDRDRARLLEEVAFSLRAKAVARERSRHRAA